MIAISKTLHRRDAVVAATRKLALSKGLPATTVDEICAAAGVTKGTFYHYFASKDEIGLASLQSYFEDLTDALSGDWSEQPDARSRLDAFLRHAAVVSVGPALEHGCLLGSFALDLAETSPVVQQAVSTMFAALRTMAASLIAEALAEAGSTMAAEDLADQFLAVLEGALLLAKGHRDRELPGRVIDSFADCMRALLAATAAPAG